MIEATKNMKSKLLKGKGEMDYDYKTDILFFKTSGREYVKSMELDKLVIDIDNEGFVVGLQLFEASQFLALDKATLMKIPRWEFKTVVEDGRIEIRLTFQVVQKNKIIEKNSIIMQPTSEPLPNSEMICEVG